MEAQKSWRRLKFFRVFRASVANIMLRHAQKEEELSVKVKSDFPGKSIMQICFRPVATILYTPCDIIAMTSYKFRNPCLRAILKILVYSVINSLLNLLDTPELSIVL